MKIIRKLFKNEKGATAIEYGLIAALIAVAAITGMRGLATSLNGTFGNVSAAMDGTGAAAGDADTETETPADPPVT